MEKNNNRPPTLTRRLLARQIRNLYPQFPLEVVEAAIREIIAGASAALVEGRPLVLRGFGRFTPRRYQSATKKRGLIFRASPDLLARLNPQGSADGEEQTPHD